MPLSVLILLAFKRLNVGARWPASYQERTMSHLCSHACFSWNSERIEIYVCLYVLVVYARLHREIGFIYCSGSVTLLYHIRWLETVQPTVPNNEACKPHLDAFPMSKHVNFYINPFVCLTNLWKTPTQKMPMWNGPNSYHIRWWETVQPTRQWSLQTTFGSLSDVQTWKSLHQSFLYAWGIYEKHHTQKMPLQEGRSQLIPH